MLLLFFSSFIFNFSYFSFPLASLVVLIGFFNFLTFSRLSSISLGFLISDEACFLIGYLTIFILFISFFYSPNHDCFIINTTIFLVLLPAFFIFLTSNIFLLYLFYEASLLPILFIIIKWGSYPERSVRAFMLLRYTAFFSFPFLMFLFFCFSYFFSFNFFLTFFYSWDISSLLLFLIFLAFSVKLPMYGLHFWLPIAHVEAPTFGSIILAGVLLKLGGVGLLRFSHIFHFKSLRVYLISYLVIFLWIVSVICCYQADFKRLVAFSSVSHIIAVPLLLLADTSISFKRLVLIMFFHGLSSPLIFMLVGIFYALFSSRQLAVLRGLLLLSPLLCFIVVLTFFFTLSAPPFPSFVREVFFFLSSFRLTFFLTFSFIIFAFFSLVYNLNWLSSVLFSQKRTGVNLVSFYSFCMFFPFSLTFFVCFSSVFRISFV